MLTLNRDEFERVLADGGSKLLAPPRTAIYAAWGWQGQESVSLRSRAHIVFSKIRMCAIVFLLVRLPRAQKESWLRRKAEYCGVVL
jgi:hypothetical protein